MKKYTFLFVVMMSALLGRAASHSITLSGFSYTPALITVQPGDSVTIQASVMHPLVQVSSATWHGGASTPLPGGWGTQTSTYTFIAIPGDTIYYLCGNHFLSGMKGRIAVDVVGGSLTMQPETASLKLYPNPAADFITLELPAQSQNYRISIFNASGQEMMSFMTAENQKTILISSFPRGFYYTATRAGNQLWRGKFLKH